MAGKSQPKPQPLALLEYVNKTFGASLWDKIEKLRIDRESGLDDRCYIPITQVCKILANYNPEIAMRTNAGTIAALAGWRRSKEIYHFDPDFAELLTSDADEHLPIPYDALYLLPFTSLYIDARIGNIDGFFVFFEHDVKLGILELRLDAIMRDSPDFATEVSLHLVGDTLEDGILDSVETVRKSLPMMERFVGRDRAIALKRKYEMLTMDFIPKAMQLVLYLGATNAEIEENAEQRTVTRRSPRIKDQYREIRKWDVGTDAGVRIRRFKSSRSGGSREMAIGTHASPTPHMRRAHWHHFWTGKRDSNDRNLVLKWIAPTFVAGNGDEASGATIIKMK